MALLSENFLKTVEIFTILGVFYEVILNSMLYNMPKLRYVYSSTTKCVLDEG